MCAVSAVIYYAQKYYPENNWDYNTLSDFTRIIQMLERIDKKMDQKDCDSSIKDRFLKDIDDRLRKLELESKQEAKSTDEIW